MRNPLVSIIIPAYNYGHLLTETLLSVVNQSYDNWECLIIDDGSADDTAVVVRSFMDKHRELNFKYFQLENRGTSAAKNAGIDKAAGELIQFLDADDLLSADKLKIQVELMWEKGAAVVFSSSAFFKMEGTGHAGYQKYPEGFLATESLFEDQLLKRLVINNIVTICSPLVKTGLIREAGKFDVTLRNNEDWMLWFKIALLQPAFIFDQNDQSYVSIRIHDHSAMNSHRQMFLGEVRVREEMDILLQQQPVSRQNTQLQKLNADLLALHRVRSLEIKKGFSYIIGNFIKDPFSNYSLLGKGCFKLMVRLYKTVIKHEN